MRPMRDNLINLQFLFKHFFSSINQDMWLGETKAQKGFQRVFVRAGTRQTKQRHNQWHKRNWCLTVNWSRTVFDPLLRRLKITISRNEGHFYARLRLFCIWELTVEVSLPVKLTWRIEDCYSFWSSQPVTNSPEVRIHCLVIKGVFWYSCFFNLRLFTVYSR